MRNKFKHIVARVRTLGGRVAGRLTYSSNGFAKTAAAPIDKPALMDLLYQQGEPLKSDGPALFWVPGGMPLMLHVEGAIAAAMKLRGVPVHAILCDGAFRGCIKREIHDGCPVSQWGNACRDCKAQTSAVLDEMGIPYSFIGDFVSTDTLDELWKSSAEITLETIEELKCGDIQIGKNAQSAILRYLRGESLAGHEDIVREYAFSALVTAEAAHKAIKKFSPSRVFMSTGIYSEWGPALKTALARGIPVFAWMASYLKGRFYFRRVEDDLRIDFHNISQEAWEERRRTALNREQENQLDEFLADRYMNRISFDMKRLKEYSGGVTKLRERYALTTEKPIWGISAHVNWDCVSDFAPMAHRSFDDWIIDTIRVIKELPEIQWLLKIHPAEAWDNPASGVQRLVETTFSDLPAHIKVIPAEEEISPLEFFELVDGGVTVYGTSGLELALQGKPVILAGEAHYGQKGFTYDGLTVQSYRELLRNAASLKALSDEQRELARQYAYCFFIQRQVPFPVVHDPNSSWWSFQIDRREMLLPEQDPFVEFICDRIMDGKDFVMGDDIVALSGALNER